MVPSSFIIYITLLLLPHTLLSLQLPFNHFIILLELFMHHSYFFKAAFIISLTCR
ncbi:hypothetical protein BDA99DRAFT_513565 [Phascolomyces articulosus]|uniref:Uncharacterized protein n=1 Tax=Phascolomyces articulosus TaxID=60185 RepID=A0AAD5JY43_9FUNG|nr:hypothetical protein BDA99DRAFT_513565 [Phascolomyces articulosus]